MYNSLSGYVHYSVNHSERFVDGLIHVNSYEPANFDFRQFLRKPRGVSKDYLDSYCSSVSFCFVPGDDSRISSELVINMNVHNQPLTGKEQNSFNN